MQPSQNQLGLLSKIAQVFEQYADVEEIGGGAVTQDEMTAFMTSGLVDLEGLSLDLRSRLPVDYDDSYLRSNPQVASQFVRYLIATSYELRARTQASEFWISSPEFPRWFVDGCRRDWAPYPHIVDAFNTLMTQQTQIASAVSGAPASAGPDLTIIVHGTWASTATWWQKGTNNFWDYVNSKVGNVYGGPRPYRWSGNNKHGARVTAAQDLLKWTAARSYQHLDVVAHSHGGNVGLLATRLGLEIRRLFLMGTPIRTEYLPNLRKIGEIHNIFSTVDVTQKAGTAPNRRGEGRTLGDSAIVLNHRATDDGTGHQPGHSELHEKNTWVASGLDGLL